MLIKKGQRWLFEGSCIIEVTRDHAYELYGTIIQVIDLKQAPYLNMEPDIFFAFNAKASCWIFLEGQEVPDE